MYNGGRQTYQESVEIIKKECFSLLNTVASICKKNEISYWIDGGTFLGAVRYGGFIPWDDDLDICLPMKDYDRLIEKLSDYCQKSDIHILFYGDTGFTFCFDYFGSSTYLIDGIYPVKIDIFPAKFIENCDDAIARDKSLMNIASIYFQGKPKNENDILELHRKWMPTGKNPVKEKERFFNFYNNYMLENMNLPENKENVLVTYSINDAVVSKNRDYFRYEDIFPLSNISFEGRNFKCPGNEVAYLTVLYGENYIKPPPPETRITHLNKLYKNDLSKKETKNLLTKFYYYGFLNFGLSKWSKLLGKPIMRLISFVRLSFHLLIRLQFKSIRNLARYSYFQIMNQ